MLDGIELLHEQIAHSINLSPYTVHSFAQQMNMKLKLLESYIDGSCVPPKKTVCKMNKFLTRKISYPVQVINI